MVARHYYRSVPEDPVTEVPTVLRWGYTLQEKAEEGEAPMIEIVVDDPDMALEFVGHRRWVVYEDDSDDANEVIYSGLTQSVKIAHKGGDVQNPMGRVWTITIADLNTLWTYRVMTGSDSQFPEQTDVERMQQLVDSEEMGYFDDTSLLSSANPVTMDKANGRGQTPAQIADSCAQQSGKNWYIYSTGSIAGGSDIGVWYGKSVSDYTSPLALSNDPADIDAQAVNDASATTYPLGADTELGKDYARQYSGAYGEFQGGAKYVVDDDTLALITLGGRDTTHPAPEIKTRERMKRRLLRVLSDHSQPDDVIRTTITLPGNKVSQLRAGMRVSFKATHLPGYEVESFLRIMSCSPRPIGRKGPYDMYAVALEMQGPGAAPATTHWYKLSTAELGVGFDGVTTPDGIYHPENFPGIDASGWESNGFFWYIRFGGVGWNLAANWSDGAAIGGSFAQAMSGNVGNVIYFGVEGPGTVTVHTRPDISGTPHEYIVQEITPYGALDFEADSIVDITTSAGPAGTDYSFDSDP